MSKGKGITRELDKLGRIVIPKSIRKALDIEVNDKLEVFSEGDRIIVKKYVPFCIFCGSDSELKEYGEKKICSECLSKLKEM